MKKKNWFLLEAKRYYQPNSYDFTIESVGVFENSEIVIKACEIMISKCEKLLENLQHGKVSIVPSETTLKNGFDITLVNEDYTLGKVIEFYLYQQNFIADKTLSFCGFRKPHPHATDSIIRLAFHNEIDPVGLSGYIQAASDNAITAFKKLVENMGGDLKKSERVRLSEASDLMSMTKASSKRGSSPKKASVAELAQSEPAVSASSSKIKKSKVPSIKVDLSKVSLPSQASSSKKDSKSKEPEEEEEE